MSSSLSRLAVASACLLLGACASPGPAPTSSSSLGRLADPGPLALPDPIDLADRNGQAVLHAQRGEAGQSIAIWEALLAAGGLRQPRHAYVLRNLGHAYALAGRDLDALPVLEQACLLDPLHALAWQRLSQVLARLGQHERAARMLAQAHSLQAHDMQRDQALLRAQAVTVPAPVPVSASVSALVPPAMERIEITQSAGIARLQRVPATTLRPRLEILNGNGMPGVAAAMARSLAAGALQIVRTRNAASFQVARTRVEYRPAQEQLARRLARQLGPGVEAVAFDCPASEVRLILGRDLDPAILHRYYVRQLEQLQRARQALARLG